MRYILTFYWPIFLLHVLSLNIQVITKILIRTYLYIYPTYNVLKALNFIPVIDWL